MTNSFENHLLEFASHSDRISKIERSHYSSFDISRNDRLTWDPENHVAVMKRHNYALLFWLDYCMESGNRPVLVHVDRHSDMAEPEMPEKKRMKDTGYAAKYVESLKVKEFITPAEHLGLLGDRIMIGDDLGNDFSNFEEVKQLAREKPVIFDLDIDIFHRSPFIQKKNEKGREQVFSWKKAYMEFAEMIELAELTTVALSPDYIDQEEAARHLAGIAEAHSELSSSSGLIDSISNLF